MTLRPPLGFFGDLPHAPDPTLSTLTKGSINGVRRDANRGRLRPSKGTGLCPHQEQRESVFKDTFRQGENLPNPPPFLSGLDVPPLKKNMPLHPLLLLTFSVASKKKLPSVLDLNEN